jgi:UDPglucose--hexose-1-phosphate uridylyltransferase
MFTERVVETGKGRLHFRRETLTGLSCRISTERIRRGIDQPGGIEFSHGGCPFCPGSLLSATPVFPGGKRILVGESVTFPNLYPFAGWHTVTVITRDHTVSSFTEMQLADALRGEVESLLGHEGYPSLNWNYLPSAGASIAHPHLQGMVDSTPSQLAGRYIDWGERYFREQGRSYWENIRAFEGESCRVVMDGEIFWYANPVPLGEKEIRGILPVSCLTELGPLIPGLARDLLRIIAFYRKLGTHAFNWSLFFDREGCGRGFSAFCSVIARINPNPLSLSDSAFMERLHLEPVILTMPEDLAGSFREKMK